MYNRRNARLSLKIRLFKAEVMKAMLYGYAPWTMRSCVPPTTSYCCASSAFGARTTPGINPYRMGRFSRGPVPNASKRQLGSTNLGLPGPLYGKATQGSQRESCLGGWSTGDVLGGLPPENFRGLRGGPAQRQRTEVGRIRGCCQGWTGLDECCEERRHVAPGGREGSGSTR